MKSYRIRRPADRASFFLFLIFLAISISSRIRDLKHLVIRANVVLSPTLLVQWVGFSCHPIIPKKLLQLKTFLQFSQCFEKPLIF